MAAATELAEMEVSTRGPMMRSSPIFQEVADELSSGWRGAVEEILLTE